MKNHLKPMSKPIYTIFIFLCLSQIVEAKTVTIQCQIQTVSNEIPTEKIYAYLIENEYYYRLTLLEVDSLGQLELEVKLRTTYTLRILSTNYETHYQEIRFRRKTPRLLLIKLKEKNDNSSEESLISLEVNGFRIQRQQADTSFIKGLITDEVGEPVMFANVALYQNDTLVLGTQTDLDGLFRFTNIPKGIYQMGVSYVGYYYLIIPFIEVKEQELLNITAEMMQGVNPDITEVLIYIPMIEQDNTTQGATFNHWEIGRSPHKN